MGRRERQLAVSPDAAARRRRRAEARAAMGVRFSERQLGVRSTDDRWRPRVRRRGHGLRLCARRGDRLRLLVVPRERRRSYGREPRQGRRLAPLSGVLRRREGERLRGRRRQRGESVERSRRRASGGARHRRADGGRGPRVRADLVAGGIGRGQPELSVLLVPRRRRVVRRAERHTPLDRVHDRGEGRAAEEDGHTWALDPDRDGAVGWSRQVGLGLDAGGGAIMWGSAADDRFAYLPITRAAQTLGVAALRLETGELAWRASPADGGAAPVSVIPGVLVFGSSAGVVYAYSTDDGKALWQFDTAREFETVNGVAAKGGTISAAGPGA